MLRRLPQKAARQARDQLLERAAARADGARHRARRVPDVRDERADAESLRKSVDHSLTYLAAPSSRTFFPYLDITHDRAVATCRAFRDLIDESSGAAPPTPRASTRRSERFEVYKSYGAPESGRRRLHRQRAVHGILHADPRREPHAAPGDYQWPLYKHPTDLASDPATGVILGRKSDAEGIYDPSTCARRDRDRR